MCVCYLFSTFLGIYSRISLEQFNIDKGLLLKDCSFVLVFISVIIACFSDIQYSSHLIIYFLFAAMLENK